MKEKANCFLRKAREEQSRLEQKDCRDRSNKLVTKGGKII